MNLSVSGNSQQNLLLRLLQASLAGQNGAAGQSNSSATSTSSASTSTSSTDASSAVGLSAAVLAFLAQLGAASDGSTSASDAGSAGGPPPGPPPGSPPGASAASDSSTSSSSSASSLLTALETDLSDLLAALDSSSTSSSTSSASSASSGFVQVFRVVPVGRLIDEFAVGQRQHGAGRSLARAGGDPGRPRLHARLVLVVDLFDLGVGLIRPAAFQRPEQREFGELGQQFECDYQHERLDCLFHASRQPSRFPAGARRLFRQQRVDVSPEPLRHRLTRGVAGRRAGPVVSAHLDIGASCAPP
jgi:hypothetical protein